MSAPAGRKLLFLLFSDERCWLNHALGYALELQRAGHTVRVIFEGPATRSFGWLADEGSRFARLVAQARDAGLITGACRTASSGCSTSDPDRQVIDLVRAAGVELLDGMDGHASVEPFVRQGFELVTF